MVFHEPIFSQEQEVNCNILQTQILIQSDTVPQYHGFIDRHRKIGKIEKSNSDFEIRYYVEPSLVNSGKVLIINCNDDGLVAKSVRYWFNPKRSYENVRINKTEVIKLKPLNSWRSFIDSLRQMNFFNFPTMDQVRPKMKKYMTLEDGRVVEKRAQIMDGATYTYQIKIGSKVRTFSYHSPKAWYNVYDNVPELKIADDIRNHFATNLIEK